MESPRLNQEDKLVVQPEVAEDRQEITDMVNNTQETKETEVPNSHNAKEKIDVENSQISTHQNIESHDLSETTKSDRKSTDEVEESSSQPAQLEKIEENNVEQNKNDQLPSSDEPINEIKNQELTSENQESLQTEEPSNKDEINQGNSETEKQMNNETEENKPEEPNENKNDNQSNLDPEKTVENKNEGNIDPNENQPVNEEKTIEKEKEESPKTSEVTIAETEDKIGNENESPKENEIKENETESKPEENISNPQLAENTITEITDTTQKEKEEKTPGIGSPNQKAKERSPKLKHLRIQTQQNSEKPTLLNLNPPADSTQEQTNNEEEIGRSDSTSITKYYQNKNLTDLVKPDSIDKSPSNMPIKRLASASNKPTNRLGSVDEENKEMQQPASASQPTKSGKLTMEDFHKITSIGRGSYGEVFLVKKISNNKLYALKAIDKNFMKKVLEFKKNRNNFIRKKKNIRFMLNEKS